MMPWRDGNILIDLQFSCAYTNRGMDQFAVYYDYTLCRSSQPLSVRCFSLVPSPSNLFWCHVLNSKFMFHCLTLLIRHAEVAYQCFFSAFTLYLSLRCSFWVCCGYWRAVPGEDWGNINELIIKNTESRLLTKTGTESRNLCCPRYKVITFAVVAF
jgi:hypothetical protein